MPKRPYISVKLKKLVANRARALCEYCKCQKAYAPGPFDIEHIIPVSLKGSSEESNLAYSCNGCNGFKCNKIEATDPVNVLKTFKAGNQPFAPREPTSFYPP